LTEYDGKLSQNRREADPQITQIYLGFRNADFVLISCSSECL